MMGWGIVKLAVGTVDDGDDRSKRDWYVSDVAVGVCTADIWIVDDNAGAPPGRGVAGSPFSRLFWRPRSRTFLGLSPAGVCKDANQEGGGRSGDDGPGNNDDECGRHDAAVANAAPGLRGKRPPRRSLRPVRAPIQSTTGRREAAAADGVSICRGIGRGHSRPQPAPAGRRAKQKKVRILRFGTNDEDDDEEDVVVVVVAGKTKNKSAAADDGGGGGEHAAMVASEALFRRQQPLAKQRCRSFRRFLYSPPQPRAGSTGKNADAMAKGEENAAEGGGGGGRAALLDGRANAAIQLKDGRVDA